METQALYIPALEFPTPSAISPLAEEVQVHTFKWAHEFRLESPEKLKRFNKGKFGWYAAREYPAANYEELCLVGDLITWLFTIDDKCDRFFFWHPGRRLAAQYVERLYRYYGTPGKHGRNTPE
ncbi:hypothetical protein QFZ51_003054 [Chitinophaga sp. W3I9]|uniref:hypothetical protein n=1 Tax=Chitinophaga sp. W3I9 TaxID=3373924 RepID=UPI003D1D8842